MLPLIKQKATLETVREYNKDKFFSRNPSYIGIVGAIKFYEHPTMGDEAGLVAVIEDGTVWLTDHYELPEHNEIYSS